jgi:hypothetical protein
MTSTTASTCSYVLIPSDAEELFDVELPDEKSLRLEPEMLIKQNEKDSLTCAICTSIMEDPQSTYACFIIACTHYALSCFAIDWMQTRDMRKKHSFTVHA